MTSVVEAKNNLSALIDRALAGEQVVITRHGVPVVTLKPVTPPPRRITQADIDWLIRHRVPCLPGPDAVALVRALRDESDERLAPLS
ncbi:type II toxin-antitoxin system prevent-host-death family antitoxin [Acidiphilium sp. AL]|nr:type II toxin-antitoxin system prevent-host-death family antitoxin [Acidiphilium sp. AL]